MPAMRHGAVRKLDADDSNADLHALQYTKLADMDLSKSVPRRFSPPYTTRTATPRGLKLAQSRAQ